MQLKISKPGLFQLRRYSDSYDETVDCSFCFSALLSMTLFLFSDFTAVSSLPRCIPIYFGGNLFRELSDKEIKRKDIGDFACLNIFFLFFHIHPTDIQVDMAEMAGCHQPFVVFLSLRRVVDRRLIAMWVLWFPDSLLVGDGTSGI